MANIKNLIILKNKKLKPEDQILSIYFENKYSNDIFILSMFSISQCAISWFVFSVALNLYISIMSKSFVIYLLKNFEGQ